MTEDLFSISRCSKIVSATQSLSLRLAPQIVPCHRRRTARGFVRNFEDVVFFFSNRLFLPSKIELHTELIFFFNIVETLLRIMLTPFSDVSIFCYAEQQIGSF